ncbi:MAG: prepilin-type N-terminal cleavage/methylation domain-containing protein [Bacilli bacterium]|nr:prepilin-type N-terminal cleavage/methylation domain-containing protein [Bacilli bacterium]
MKNNNGFTLIELLAVITIMGILMMVAIPTVSRTIENSRKDTFIDTAKKYADSAQTMWMGDNLSCMTVEGKRFNSSAVPTGTYYIEIDTTSDSVPVLLEQGGKSSWGSRDIKGYVKVEVSTKKYLYGDVNLDGSILSSDVVAINGYVAGSNLNFNELQKRLADVNGDGLINGYDANLIMQKVGGAAVNFATEAYYEHVVEYFPVISDDVHGINLNGSANVIESEKIVRGDLVMSGASYDRVALPATALICIER